VLIEEFDRPRGLIADLGSRTVSWDDPGQPVTATLIANVRALVCLCYDASALGEAFERGDVRLGDSVDGAAGLLATRLLGPLLSGRSADLILPQLSTASERELQNAMHLNVLPALGGESGFDRD
jgi:hypothetical protein